MQVICQEVIDSNVARMSKAKNDPFAQVAAKVLLAHSLPHPTIVRLDQRRRELDRLPTCGCRIDRRLF